MSQTGCRPRLRLDGNDWVPARDLLRIPAPGSRLGDIEDSVAHRTIGKILLAAGAGMLLAGGWLWYRGLSRPDDPKAYLTLSELRLEVFGSPETLPFDSEDWKAAGRVGGDLGKRFRMLEDLLARYELVGMHAEEVETLLGPMALGRERTSGFSYAYPLSSTEGFRTTLLILDLDTGEHVVAYQFDDDPPHDVAGNGHPRPRE